MVTLEQVQETLESHYNSAMSVYHYTGVVRLTNGSAGMYINIIPEEDGFTLAGERYGERLYEKTDDSTEDIVETLGTMI